MKRKRCNFFFVASCIYRLVPACLLCLQLNAQEFDIKRYTTKDGLSSSYVWSINQDKLGYLWLGTSNGLNRFDGKDFIQYGVTDGLPDARTSSVFMDSHSRLWVGTSRGMAELRGGK